MIAADAHAGQLAGHPRGGRHRPREPRAALRRDGRAGRWPDRSGARHRHRLGRL